MEKNEKIFAAVDVGSTKVVAIVGKRTVDDKIEIIGFGHSISRGVKRGIVLNVEEAFLSVSEAVSQAEKSSGFYIENVFVNISGQHLTTLNSTQQKTFSRGHCINEGEVKQMIEQAKLISLPEEMSIYHLNPGFYTIDEEAGIANPVGAICEKIECTYKIHIAPLSYQQNVEMCLNKGSIKLQKAVLDPIASAEVVLSEEEKETGVALVDIGGGTTKISIFCEGVLCFTSMVPFGGNVVTRDIKEGCAITARQAESLKVQFGQAIGDFAPENKVVNIPPLPGGWEPKHISFKNLAHIIQARMDEIIAQIFYQIQKSGYAEKLGAGIVITGGTSLLPNLVQLVKFHTGFDARVGKPNMNTFIASKELNNPTYSTVLGLLKMAVDADGLIRKKGRRLFRKEKSDEPGIFKTMQTKIAQQVFGFFEDSPGDTEMS